MKGFFRRLRSDERGISASIVAVSLIALLSAAVLSIDTGQLFTTRRTIITATDAAALHAANMFDRGALDPCESTAIATAETGATDVMLKNHTGALHNGTDTPDGFEVTLADPTLCGTGAYVPGKVRFDGRLGAPNTFSRVLGTGEFSAISSSTAAWGYITASGEGTGLRPIAVCDQSTVTWADPLPAPTDVLASGGPYPHYELWRQNWFYNHQGVGVVDDAFYDSFFGIGPYGIPGSTPVEYPIASDAYLNGTSPHNPNKNKLYVAPSDDARFSTIHRLRMPDQDCGVEPGNRVWVDFRGAGGGTVGASELRDQLLRGYNGTVSLTPHDCNPSDTENPQDCGVATGDKATLETALGTITCRNTTPALECPYIFSVLVMNNIFDTGGTAHYVQVAFLTTVLRGFGDLESNGNFEMDFEFVDLQTSGASGQVSSSPPDPNHPYQTGVLLCGADHDAFTDRCPF